MLEKWRHTDLQLTSRQLQGVVQGLFHRHGGRNPRSTTRLEPAGKKNLIPEDFSNNTGFKQWRRRHKLAGGAEDGQFKICLEWP